MDSRDEIGAIRAFDEGLMGRDCGLAVGLREVDICQRAESLGTTGAGFP
jgi:hypothetical protein